MLFGTRGSDAGRQRSRRGDRAPCATIVQGLCRDATQKREKKKHKCGRDAHPSNTVFRLWVATYEVGGAHLGQSAPTRTAAVMVAPARAHVRLPNNQRTPLTPFTPHPSFLSLLPIKPFPREKPYDTHVWLPPSRLPPPTPFPCSTPSSPPHLKGCAIASKVAEVVTRLGHALALARRRPLLLVRASEHLDAINQIRLVDSAIQIFLVAVREVH